MKAVILMAVMLCAGSVLFAQRTDTIIIHFEFDKSYIRPASAATLDSFFTANRIANINQLEVYGHCDYIGNHAYNDGLSSRRVEQTMKYLIDKGISENSFIKNEGFGKRRPLNENKTSLERLQNRRVELVVHWQEKDVVTQPVITEPKSQPTLTEIINDSTTKAGKNIILRNLQFQGGRHFLLPESQPILDELVKVMIDNPTLVIEIQGHVCCTADNVDGLDIDLQTYDLSIQRARAIYTHLVIKGIANNRLSFRGFGGSRKLYPLERDDFERQENRRVELRIVKR